LSDKYVLQVFQINLRYALASGAGILHVSNLSNIPESWPGIVLPCLFRVLSQLCFH